MSYTYSCVQFYLSVSTPAPEENRNLIYGETCSCLKYDIYLKLGKEKKCPSRVFSIVSARKQSDNILSNKWKM